VKAAGNLVNKLFEQRHFESQADEFEVLRDGLAGIASSRRLGDAGR
jgi:hypothetical protein